MCEIKKEEVKSLNPYPAPPTVASATKMCGDPSLTGMSCPAFPRASAVKLEVTTHRLDMQQCLENLAGQRNIPQKLGLLALFLQIASLGIKLEDAPARAHLAAAAADQVDSVSKLAQDLFQFPISVGDVGVAHAQHRPDQALRAGITRHTSEARCGLARCNRTKQKLVEIGFWQFTVLNDALNLAASQPITLETQIQCSQELLEPLYTQNHDDLHI